MEYLEKGGISWEERVKMTGWARLNEVLSVMTT